MSLREILTAEQARIAEMRGDHAAAQAELVAIFEHVERERNAYLDSGLDEHAASLTILMRWLHARAEER